MTERARFTDEIAETLAYIIKTAPESQISHRIRSDSLEFLNGSRSLGEIYDHVTAISKKPITEVSQFIKTALDVPRFYDRPAI